MEGCVARKGNRWYAVIYEGVDPKTGKERRRWYPAGTDRGEAEALAARLGVTEDERRAGRRSQLTVSGFLLRYWLPAKQLQLAAVTFAGYQRMIRLHVLPHIGDMVLRKLRPEQLEQLYTQLLEHGRSDGKGGLSPKTVLEIHVILRAALGDALRKRYLRDNPARTANAPRHRRTTRRTHRVWTADQLRCFLQLTAGARHHATFWLAANTGMRRSELLGLRWDQIDVTARRLSVCRSVVSIGYQVHESAGKTRSSRRTIDLDPKTIETLIHWRQQQHAEMGAHDPEGPLFTKPDGTVIHPHSLSQAFERAVAKTALPKISLHDLRHTHATLLLKAGVPLKVVSERLGHSSPAFTMATYQHILPGMQAEAAATFASLLEPDASTG